jgi:hypothetical protein
MASAAGAAKLKTLLEGARIEGVKSQKVEAPPPEEKQQWVTWQLRSDVATVRALAYPASEAKK